MKTFEVIVTPEAQSGIREAFSYIFERSPANAGKWLQGLYVQINTLERTPERCAYARERAYLDCELRQLVFKSHRIVFYVDKAKSAVYVLHVRHAQRRAVGEPKE